MRQHIDIVLSDKDYSITPNFDMLERVEQRFSLLEFLGSVQSGKTKFSMVAWVLYCAFNANGYKIGYPEVGDIVMEDLPKATVEATSIITEMLGSGPEKPIKKKNQEAKGNGLA